MTLSNIFVKTFYMNKRFFRVIPGLLFLTLTCGGSVVLAKLNPAKASQTIMECTAKRLQLRDCHVSIGDVKIQVWNEKIFYRSTVAQKIIPLDGGAQADWQFVRLKKLAEVQYLEIGIWTTPKGDGEVASLEWSLYLLSENDLSPRGGGVIGKRRINKTSGKYSYDKKVEYGVFERGPSIQWFVGKDKGVLSEL